MIRENARISDPDIRRSLDLELRVQDFAHAARARRVILAYAPVTDGRLCVLDVLEVELRVWVAAFAELVFEVR